MYAMQCILTFIIKNEKSRLRPKFFFFDSASLIRLRKSYALTIRTLLSDPVKFFSLAAFFF